MQGKQGFTLLELLIVLGILSIILGISVVSGRQILKAQEERAALHSFRQAVTRAATAANSKNAFVSLRMKGDEIVLRNTTTLEDFQTYPIPDSVQTSIGNKTDPFLEFGPNGKLTSQFTQSASQLQFIFQTDTSTYDIEVSLIGEVRVDPK